MTRRNLRYRCWSCGELFPSWAAAQRHVDANRRTVDSGHGGRVEIEQGSAQQAGWAALTTLRDRHPDEYEQAYADELARRGVR